MRQGPRADRIASGEVLYRDISTGVTPGSFYLHALLFQVFGREFEVDVHLGHEVILDIDGREPLVEGVDHARTEQTATAVHARNNA